MKKYLILAFVTVLWSCGSNEESTPETTVSGCTDPLASNYESVATEEDCSCLYDGFSAVGTPPASAAKNVFLEEFTGEWCGWCVDGTARVEDMLQENPGRLFVMGVHQGDFLENSTSQNILRRFAVQSFPSGIVDRKREVVGRNLWESRVNQEIQTTANADIALETKLDGNTLEGVVYVDFKNDQGDKVHYLTLFILENGIPARAQQNYYNNRQGSENHPYFGKPAVLGPDEYVHDHVVRTKIRDFQIATKATSNEGVYSRKFEADLSSYVAENVEIIAIVTQGSGNNILNVNGVVAGEVANWD